jgi:hypothetical protein
MKGIFISLQKNYKKKTISCFLDLRWQEVFDLPSNPFKTPFLGVIEFSAEIAQAFMERCITKQDTINHETKKPVTTVSLY